MMTRRIVVLTALVALVASACGGGGSDKPSAVTTPKSPNTVSVYGAPNLKGVLATLAAAYKASHPTNVVDVQIQGETELVAQVASKAAGVVIMPDAWRNSSTRAARFSPFGRSFAVIAVRAGNPAHVADAKVFASGSALRTVACGEDTSLGNFAALVLQRSGVTPAKGLVHAGCAAKSLAQIAAGSLDAALVFRSDAKPPKGVEFLNVIPPQQNVVVAFSSAILGTSTLAKAFGAYLATPAARTLLTENGYLP